MFRRCTFNAFRAIVVVAAIFMQPFAALAGTGTAQEAASVPEMAKLSPVTVSADTSTLPPKVADAENEAVWRLFDRDTGSAYISARTARITVGFTKEKNIGRLRIYGAPACQLNVYRDNGGSWEPVPSLSGVSLDELRATSWNTIAATTPFTTANLLLEFVPKGNATASIPELEIWGTGGDATASDSLHVTLDGINTPRMAYAILDKKAPHVTEIAAAPSEVTVPDGSADGSFTAVNIFLAQKPSLFKRAYLLYEGSNIATPAEVQKRINNLSWTGGLAVARAEGTCLEWAPQIEEINPAWLVQGENSIKFRSPKGQAYIRNLKLIVETDSGWNSVVTSTSPALFDGDSSTAFDISASSGDLALQIHFERAVEAEKIQIHLRETTNLKATLQYSTGNGWQDMKPGWQIDFSAMQAGWNEILLPTQVTASDLRLVFTTGNPSPETGVQAGAIDELRVCASPAGPASPVARIVVSYPRNGEYYGRTAYIQGFAIPAANVTGQAQVDISGKSSVTPEDAFSVSLTKDETSFSSQADGETWTAFVTSAYAGQAGASRTVALTGNLGAVNAASSKTESSADAQLTNQREKHSDKVAPGQAKKIAFKGVTLDIPEGAVDKETEISIIPLTEADLARLDPGMINVTSPHAGYRFLPHGMKFKKAIKISFGYSKSRLGAGQRDDDVHMFYYDETLLRWQQLARVKIDPAALVAVSESDHFTDIINSTLVVPEHPQALNYNPNSIKDIKAADPGAEVNLVEPPQANNKGAANLSYPIEIPPGRNNIQPNIGVQYNSSGGNGWMGIGWDIPVQAIAIDTRWGVPRYDAVNETETYALDGEQLTPLAHRGVLQPRTAEKVFHTRVEGQFKKITRHGTAPNNYWWEVVDKNGTRYFYGGAPDGRNLPDSEAVLANPGNGNIFKWALRQVRDTNGNTMNYGYAAVSDTGIRNGAVSGHQLYLKKIDYTGHDGKAGAYTAVFNRDRELPGFTPRSDITIDARSGFKMVTADTLRSIEIYFGGSYSNGTVLGGSLVRRYVFGYNEDAYGDHRPGTAFNKTLLTSVSQYGKDGGLFNTHRFTYYDEARNSDGSYHGFASSSDWRNVGDDVNAGLFGYGDASALGGNSGAGYGGHLYVGVGPAGNVSSKENTGGLKVGFNSSSSESVLAMADMDGDGLPDKVFKGSDGFYYRKNLSGPHGASAFGEPVKVAGLTAISEEKATTVTIGGESYFGVAVMNDVNWGESTARTYFSDVNGDGLTDLVNGGHVLFGYINDKGAPVFSSNSADTPAPVGAGAIDTNGLLEDPSAEEAELAANFPLLDTLRRWVAPYDGTVRIDAPVQLMPVSGDDDGTDGVQVAIQQEGVELWSMRTLQVSDFRTPVSPRILAGDFSTHTPSGVDSVQVKRGDRIYFRVQSVFNGSKDRVSWNPDITYLNTDTNRTDVNGLPAYRYRASDDFTLAGRRGTVNAPLTGTLHLAGTLNKTAATTDDVTLLITRNGSEVFRRTFGYADSASAELSQDLAVTLNDTLEWRILVDSPIDATKIQFAPKAYYTAATGVDNVRDGNGNYVIQVAPPYAMDTYPADNLTAPQGSWTATQTGNLTVVAALNSGAAGSSSQTVFTVKKRGALLAKSTMDETPLTLTVPVTAGDELFFDFSSRDVTASPAGVSTSVQVSYGAASQAVPSAFHAAVAEGLFPAPYRGWGAAGYNGNAPRDGQAIDQSLLAITGSFDPKSARAYPFAPLPAESAWGGVDKEAWVKAAEARSSRLGLKDIRMPRSEDFIGASAPSRVSKSNNLAASVSGGGAGAGYSTGDSKSKLDYMDLNGDHLPDVIGQSGVQYTFPTGVLEPKTRGDAGAGSPRASDNTTYEASINSGGSIATAIAAARGLVAPGGERTATTSSQGTDMPSLGIGGNASYGTSETKYDLIDVNGDGLPDKVFKDGTVSLNLGYAFAPAEPWEGGSVNNGETLNFGINMGFNVNWYSLAGGLNLGLGSTWTHETYVDINGDGLPDKVYEGSPMTVRLNTGAGFSAPIPWPGGQSKVALDKHISLGGGVYFTFGFNIYAVRVVFNPGFSYSETMGRPEYAFRDMDGDGFVDHVFSDKNSKLNVAGNPIGRTNLLKSVKRPLGGKIDLEYAREGNTYEMPQSQWLMSGMTLTDGMGRAYKTAYAYSGPYHDRYEREFYGFARVDEIHAPGAAIARTVSGTFLNRDYYLKGLLDKSVTLDNLGNVWAKKANTYVASDVVDGSRFPQLQRSDTYFYDGTTNESSFKKSTFETFAYDNYGNVTTLYDAGELGTTADDLTATITYWNDPQQYIMKPDTIIVRNSGNNVLRKRWASYDTGTGNLKSQATLTSGNQNSLWQMSYDPYGNIRTIIDPVGYALTYDYDSDTNTYVTRIQDNFTAKDGGPYYSTAGYDLKFGKPAWTKDLNGNYVVTSYDQFGRPVSIFGPYDTGSSGVPAGLATLSFEFKAPVFAGDGETLATPASAITRNKAVSRIGADANTLDTVIFGDGMKRVLQAKKEADVYGSYGMVASGLAIYDDLARTIEQGQPVFQSGGDLYGYLPLQYPKNPARTAYDPLDRTVRLETPDNNASGGYAVTATTYGFGQANGAGPLYASTKVVDPIGAAAFEAGRKGTKISYKDVDGHIMALIEFNRGLPITTTYNYDPLGQITTVRDNQGNTTTVEYDLAGRRTAITNPDTGRTAYSYDAGGNLITKLTANYTPGKEIKYDYIFNRLTKINYPTTTSVLYEYGPMGAAYNSAARITRVTDESGIEERFYGKLGEMTREVKQVNAKTPAASRKIYTTDYVFDSFGRMLQMTYPDGENLYYAYDNGGLLNAAWAEKNGNRYTYITSLTYDEFGQRRRIANGNGVTSIYSYDDKTRRLESLITQTTDTRIIQNLSYNFDLVGNILKVQNRINTPTSTALPAGPATQNFEYDDLYQLTTANGQYQFGPGKQNLYTNEFAYDTIGNFTRKNQIHKILQPSMAEHLPKETNYLLDYKYTGFHPHAVTDAGDKTYNYDNNGNMTGWHAKKSGQRRTIVWNEENRVNQIQDNGKTTYFLYNDQGERVLKRGQHGETFYINRFYSIRNGELGTKCVYAGNTRIASKLVKTPNTASANSGQGNKTSQPVEKDQYFYHGDHLGSSNMITDTYGEVYQHLEYFPYGETWIDEGKTPVNIPGYQFTGKELDPETGLYYFGARYYEPKISRWISADPILGEYLPSGNVEHDQNLPGIGGVFNPVNIDLFHYAGNNPVKYVDADGNDFYLHREQGGAMNSGHMGTVIVGKKYATNIDYASWKWISENKAGRLLSLWGMRKPHTGALSIRPSSERVGKKMAYDKKPGYDFVYFKTSPKIDKMMLQIAQSYIKKDGASINYETGSGSIPYRESTLSYALETHSCVDFTINLMTDTLDKLASTSKEKQFVNQLKHSLKAAGSDPISKINIINGQQKQIQTIYDNHKN